MVNEVELAEFSTKKLVAKAAAGIALLVSGLYFLVGMISSIKGVSLLRCRTAVSTAKMDGSL